jgi:hypothetical protein
VDLNSLVLVFSQYTAKKLYVTIPNFVIGAKTESLQQAMAHKDHDTHAPPLGFQKDHDKECVQLYMDDFKKSTYSYTIPLHKNTNNSTSHI